MKELSIEEKAQRYDEAVELAAKFRKEYLNYKELNVHKGVIEAFNNIFPELKESEDEKIRKLLIEAVIQVLQDQYCSNRGVSKEKVVSWLEKQGEHANFLSKIQVGDKVTRNKGGVLVNISQLNRVAKKRKKQGEQKPDVIIPKFRIGDYVKNVNDKREPIYEIVYMDKKCYICEYRGKENMGDKAVMHFAFDNPYLRLVQKSADKVEPKFKVGDWVIDKQGIVHKIANVIENVTYHTYGYDIVGGGYFNDNTEGVRLWTIQDAKDGDVLATDGGVCIFNGILEEGKYPFAYCGITKIRGFESYNGYLPFSHDNNIHPATKEQRDTLEKAITNAGYRWDKEKLKLEKV